MRVCPSLSPVPVLKETASSGPPSVPATIPTSGACEPGGSHGIGTPFCLMLQRCEPLGQAGHIQIGSRAQMDREMKCVVFAVFPARPRAGCNIYCTAADWDRPLRPCCVAQ